MTRPVVIGCLQKGCWTRSAWDFQFVLKGVQELASILFFPSSFCQEPNRKIIKKKRNFWRRRLGRVGKSVAGRQRCWQQLRFLPVSELGQLWVWGCKQPGLPCAAHRGSERLRGWRLLKAHTCSHLSKRQQRQTCCQLEEREEGILVKVFPRPKYG